MLNITIFFVFSSSAGKADSEYTVNMCTLSYRDTPDFVHSEPHFPPKLVGRSVWYKVYADVLSIYVNSRWIKQSSLRGTSLCSETVCFFTWGDGWEATQFLYSATFAFEVTHTVYLPLIQQLWFSNHFLQS